MSNTIVLKKGLELPVSGKAAPVVTGVVIPDTVAVCPDDFKGLKPRLLVKEGDKVLAGSPVLSHKDNPDILVTSPVSGTVKQVIRGDKRKLLAVLIQKDPVQESIDFGAKDPATLDAQQVKEALLQSGLWSAIIQRPYGIVADPAASPKGIFVSLFSTAPLHVCSGTAYAPYLDAIQTGIDALAKLAPVHIGIGNKCADKFKGLKGCGLHLFKGRHPAGNVGIQIANIDPIRKGETVWTLTPSSLIAVGRLFKTGKLNLRRIVAVTGPMAIEPSYIETVPGMPMSYLSAFVGTSTDVRYISGDMLSGKNAGPEGYLGFFDDQITLIREGREEEWFGWARPLRLGQYSADHTYFNWCLKPLMRKRKYDMDTNLHGGPRAFVMSDSYYAKVLPMDIYPLYLVKACLAADIDKMEKFGIYEVLPEDLATCEYIDPSKNNIQSIISDGINLMLKEMA